MDTLPPENFNFLRGNNLKKSVNSQLEKDDKKIFIKYKKLQPKNLLKHVIKQYIGDDKLPKVHNVQSKRILNHWINQPSIENLQKLIISVILDSNNQHQKNLEDKGHSRIIVRSEHKNVICGLPSNKFYHTPEWKRLRYQVIRDRGNICECCGTKKSQSIQIHVDHIKPRSIYPELSLKIDNLQILCEACNIGKSNLHEDDWRI